MRRVILASCFLAIAGASVATAQTRQEKVLADRKKFEADGFWIYNDFARGLAEAKKSGKPLIVTLRCIPCEECVKLDDELVHEDKRVRSLLEKFVRVRIVSTNGLDLSLFQFDTDQSFAVFLMNADGAIYGRYGTRSHRTSWSDDVSIDGLARALEGALDLHANFPRNKAELDLKRGPAPEVASPELFPSLKSRYTSKVDFDSKPVASCIHCHQIGDAQRDFYRAMKSPMPTHVLFPFPHPKILGLVLNPRERATIMKVEKGSPAEKAGLQEGDRIIRLEGQSLLSIADFQWVLHRTSPDTQALKIEISRGEATKALTFELPKGWRQRDDISWRASTWGLRRMALGGLKLSELSDPERKKFPGDMALRIEHVGQYGAHAAAQNAGFKKDDVIISIDGLTNLSRETDALAHLLTTRRPGERVPVRLIRNGKELTLMLPMQP